MVVACPISVQAKGEPAAIVPATIQPKSVPQGESSKLMAWSLAVPDWQDQIRTGKSLIPDLPLLDSQQCFATTDVRARDQSVEDGLMSEQQA